MPRPRKPTEVLELSGAFAHNPSRRRPAGPKNPEGIGDPPPALADAAKAAWREIVADAPAGVLTRGERILVEVAARLVVKHRGGNTTAAETSQLLKCLSALGMTAVDRDRVVARSKEAAAASPFDEFLN